jgi:hypothetical protein
VIQAETKAHALWEKTITFASNCSWTAGRFLAQRMRRDEFKDWERVIVAIDHDHIAGFSVFSEKDGLPKDYELALCLLMRHIEVKGYLNS